MRGDTPSSRPAALRFPLWRASASSRMRFSTAASCSSSDSEASGRNGSSANSSTCIAGGRL